MKKVYPKEDVCIGCRLCEIHCLVQHSKSKDIIKAFKKEFPRALKRIRVEEKRPISFAVQCRHCSDAPCVSACLTGAMSKDERGAVLHNPDKCIGCWTCIMVCPFGAIQPDKRGKRIVAKCDLCPGEEVPACVVHCPNRALVYEERQEK